MKEKNSKKISKIEPRVNKIHLPPEIIWIIFNQTDSLTLVQCARTCYLWHSLVLANSFLKEQVDHFIANAKEELGSLIEKIKTEREGLEEIDPAQIVNITIENRNTTYILTQLQNLENKIEKNQNKLIRLIEREEEKKQSGVHGFIGVTDGFGGGGYYVAYEGSHQPSFFGDIKRMIQKAHYKKTIKDAEKEEEKTLNNLTRNN